MVAVVVVVASRFDFPRRNENPNFLKLFCFFGDFVGKLDFGPLSIDLSLIDVSCKFDSTGS